MDALLSSPGMIVTTIIVLVMQVLSLCMLWINLHFFRKQSLKYQSLIGHFGNASDWGTPGKILKPLYIVTTLLASAVMVYLFVFQPHLL